MMKFVRSALGALFLLSLGNTHAALFDRGGGLIYDDDLNVTWLQDANLAMSNTFGVSGINIYGRMTWDTAKEWTSAMNTFNGGAGYLGYNNWRLPMSDSCLGYGCRNSELGHLFFSELGGMPGVSISATHNANYTLFENIQDNQYWSGTELASDTSRAFLFYFNLGYTNELSKRELEIGAWAVRDGDVAAVTEPEAYALMLAGLGLLGVMMRRAERR